MEFPPIVPRMKNRFHNPEISMETMQATIRKEISLEGIGLHTGSPSMLTFRPAPANTGIRFFRSDLPGHPMVPARLDFVVTTVRGTNLGLGEAKIHTVEHVLSACTGAGIDNIDVWVSAPEPPIMDGSALPFVKAILTAGIERYSDAPKRWLHLPGEVSYQDGKAKYRAIPSDNFEIKATLIHEHPLMPEMVG